MNSTIRNPVQWGWDQVKHAGTAVESAGRSLLQTEDRMQAEKLAAPMPTVRHISIADLGDVVARGAKDFGAYRTDVVFLCVIYPVVGLVLARLAFGYDMLPLLFPLASGFAIVGPFAAIGLYEMSRRREQGAEINWLNAFDVLRSPNIAAIVVLGLVLMAIFLVWIWAANWIYKFTVGLDLDTPLSMAALFHNTFTTPAGLALIVFGCGVGFLFALLALSVSVISFPLLLDRDIGLGTAIRTSMRAVERNPKTMAAWGVLVAAGLILGSIPLFIGLIVVMPVLGHATWHLYRKIVPL